MIKKLVDLINQSNVVTTVHDKFLQFLIDSHIISVTGKIHFPNILLSFIVILAAAIGIAFFVFFIVVLCSKTLREMSNNLDVLDFLVNKRGLVGTIVIVGALFGVWLMFCTMVAGHYQIVQDKEITQTVKQAFNEYPDVYAGTDNDNQNILIFAKHPVTCKDGKLNVNRDDQIVEIKTKSGASQCLELDDDTSEKSNYITNDFSDKERLLKLVPDATQYPVNDNNFKLKKTDAQSVTQFMKKSIVRVSD